jgi:hypothetical protein
MLEAHHRRGDRDAALALDRHPIRAHPPPLATRLDFPRQLDRPAKQQQFLGQGGLAGVRMRDDRKGAPARNLVAKITHQPVSIIPGNAASFATAPSAFTSGGYHGSRPLCQRLPLRTQLTSC